MTADVAERASDRQPDERWAQPKRRFLGAIPWKSGLGNQSIGPLADSGPFASMTTRAQFPGELSGEAAVLQLARACGSLGPQNTCQSARAVLKRGPRVPAVWR